MVGDSLTVAAVLVYLRLIESASYWQQLGVNGKGPVDASAPAYTIPFTASAVVPKAPGAAQILIAVEAKTDRKWQDASGAEGDSPKKPQTHLVRARSEWW